MKKDFEEIKRLLKRKEEMVDELISLLRKEIELQTTIFIKKKELDEDFEYLSELKSKIIQIQIDLENIDFEIDH